jgi:hypothetical protein
METAERGVNNFSAVKVSELRPPDQVLREYSYIFVDFFKRKVLCLFQDDFSALCACGISDRISLSDDMVEGF